MTKISFYAQMCSETGTPEFFLDQPYGSDHHVMKIGDAKEILLGMKRQLSFFLTSASDVDSEYDLDLIDNELVLWELEENDDSYQTTTHERIISTLGEIDNELKNLPDFEANSTTIPWQHEGF